MEITKIVPVVPDCATHEKKADTFALKTAAMSDEVQFTANESNQETRFVPQVNNKNKLKKRWTTIII